MKHWNETEAILARVAELVSSGRAGALATVVQISGSAYRRPGAKFLIEDDGRTQGGVSGGCLEADVREVAQDVMRTGRPRLRHYDTGSDDRVVWGLGLGCNGAVDVFIQPIADLAGDPWTTVREWLRGDEPFAVSTVVEGPHAGRSQITAAGGQSRLEPSEGGRTFTDALTPPPHLVIFGAGEDARPVVACAADAGFQVTVVDHRPAYLTADRFPAARRLLQMRPEGFGGLFLLGSGSSAVLMTHSLALDREWLRKLLGTAVRYIGVLGPRERIDEILRQIGATRDDRVFGPVGLDVGADGPEQIAISIVAELLAVRARREARHLRERKAGIHAVGS